MNFTRDLCQQRDVTVEIETMDKVMVQNTLQNSKKFFEIEKKF